MPTVPDPSDDRRAKARREARAHLTAFLSSEGPRSYLRVGDNEVRFLLGEEVPLVGLSGAYSERLREAYEQCRYLDLCTNQAFNRGRLEALRLAPSAHTCVNADPETGNLIRTWTYECFHDFIAPRATLIVAAESALLERLHGTPAYRDRARAFWPPDARVHFLQPRANGAHLDRDLDGILADARRAIERERIEAVFVCLGAGAKIACHELAEACGIAAIDWGSMARALSNSAGRGDTQGRDYCPFFVDVPFKAYMDALRAAHPELAAQALLMRAHAQLRQELSRRRPMIGKFQFDPSRANMGRFRRALAVYRRELAPLADGDDGAREELRAFAAWRREHRLDGWGLTRRYARLLGAGLVRGPGRSVSREA